MTAALLWYRVQAFALSRPQERARLPVRPLIISYLPVCMKKPLTDFGRWPAGATCVRTLYSLAASLAVAHVYTLTT